MGIADVIRRMAGAGTVEGGRRMRATWNGAVIAESDSTVVVEGNHYFPAASVDPDHLRDSSTHSVCAWKGTASYYDVVVNGKSNRDAAWYYPEPSPGATRVLGKIAFWHGVDVSAAPPS